MKRRFIIGLTAGAVVVAMTGVTTWALADDNTAGKAAAAPVKLVVGYKDGADRTAATRSLLSAGARKVASGASLRSLGALNADAVQVSAARSAALVAELRRDPTVAYVEADRTRTAFDLAPNDPAYVQGRQPEVDQVNLPAAWQVTTGSAVRIAVLDTGVNVTGDLAGAVAPGYNVFTGTDKTADDVPGGHGTTVASLIAARGNNGQGMAGACWSCEILPVKVLDRSGSGSDSGIADGIVWATQNRAKVINMSLGGEGTSKVLADAVNFATDRGVLVVAAAGNEHSSTRSYPAAYTDVLSVGATAWGSTARASFSNFNAPNDKWVDVAAPGDVLGMGPNGTYTTGQQGTSFASPIVAGIAGLVKTQRPTYNGFSLMRAIQASGRPIGNWTTYGLVDAAKSFNAGSDTTPPSITGVAPAQGAKVRGTITVKPVGVGDGWSGVRGVDLYVDNLWKAFDRFGPYELKYNSAGRNGTINLRLKVSDKAGNVTWFNRSLIADNTAPAVKITKAPKNKTKVKGTVKISFTGSDTYGIRAFQLVINGKVVASRADAKAPLSFVASKQPAKMTVLVRATDVAGNVRNSAAYSYTR